MASLKLVGLALVLLVSLSKGDDKCRTGCQGVTPNVFKYAEGTTYKYEYEGNVDLSLSSAEGQHSSTKVKATVLLTQQAECNQILRIKNLQIVSADSKRYTNIDDIEKPIKLNFHDGHIEDVICTESSDTQNSLNIKRAVASLFQAALKHHGKEIDVFGSCPTQFSQRKEGQFQVIKKIRNLNKCSHRESLQQDFISSAFDHHSEIKSSPFLQGDYEAELKLKNGIPQVITVKEDYLYVPFSNGDKGAKSNVVSQLKFVETTKDNPKVSCSTPKTILFEDPHPLTTEKSTVGGILNGIKEVSNGIDVNVKENTASKFNNIIRLLRSASKKDIAAIYAQVRSGAGFVNKDTARRVFLDALFRTSTGEAVEVAIDIYKSNGLNEVETKVFFVGLNFIKHVTGDALSAAANLLSSSDNLPREAYLGIGVLAGRFCRQHSCENVKGLNVLLKALQAKITSRPQNRQVENLVVTILKSIANAEHVTNALAGKIVEAAQDKQAPARIRVAALEAYLADPCNDRFRDSGINILKDIQQDSEIRIKAYLAIAECPNGKVAGAIKKLLEDEPSIQVGGFIVSHLATIRTSSNPDKAVAKTQLGEIRTTKKFPVDFRQYSFNGEYSYDVSTLGIAESAEADVIYSQKSFLPRSTSLNLTTEIFGHRYNFLEIDTRQENLDAVIGTFIGPNGLLRKPSLQNLLSSGSKNLKKIVEDAKQRIAARPKRDVSKNQIEAFSKQISDKQNPLNKDLDLDLSIKLFGSELFFLSLNEDIKKYQLENIIEEILNCVDKTKAHARDFDKTLTSNLLFLDTTVSYPTSTGFPLRLNLEGTSSTQLKTSGKLDINDLLQLNGNFKLSVIPSVSVELKARFVLDAAVVESGLSVVGNLYSSIGGSFEASAQKDQFDYKFKLPLDKQEIISFSHNIVFETRELGGNEVRKPLKFIQSKDFSVCLDQLNPFIGLTFCASLNQPNIAEESTNVLPYPLNGDSKVAVYVENADFGYLHLYEKEEGLLWTSAVEIIDKQNKPKASIKLQVSGAEPLIILDFTSPIKSARFEARLVNTNSEFSGLLRLTSDQLEYYAKLGVSYAASDTRIVYKPIMEYKAGQGAAKQLPYHITGQIILEQISGGRKFIFDNVKLISPDAKPIGIAGNIANQKEEFSADLTLDDGTHKGSVKGKLQLEKRGLNLNAQLVNDFNRAINFDLKYKLHLSDRYNVDSDLQLIHGPDISDKNALFRLANSLKYSGQGDDSVFETEHELSYSGLNIDDKFKLKSSRKELDVEVQFAYKNVKVGTDLEVELDKKNKGDLDFDLELYGFENKLEIVLNRIVAGYKSKVNHKFSLNGNSIEVNGEVKHLLEQNRGDIGQDLVIKITSRPDIKLKSEFKYTQNDVDTSIKVTSGQDVYIDAFLKANKGGDANGNLKVSIPNRVTANGQIRATKGSGTTSLLLNFLEIQRKVKSEASFTIKDPTYNFDIILYSNFEKDNTRKYQLTTANTIKEGSLLDTKNTLDVLGQKTVVNLKLAQSGDINDLEQKAEYEIILANEQYFSGKLNRKIKNDKGLLNGEGQIYLEQRPSKNAAGRTLSFKGIGKNINTNEGTLDLSYNLALDNGAGKTLNGDLQLKQTKQGEHRQIDYHSKIHGSVLPEPIDTTLNIKYNSKSADYKLSTSCGHKASLNVKSKYQLQESGQPSTGDLYIDLQQPTSQIRIVKFSVQGSLVEPKTDDDSFELKASTSIFVDDDGTQAGATLDVKSESDIKLSATKGYIKETIRAQKLDPISINLGYEYAPDKKYLGNAAVEYAAGKVVKGTIEIDTPDAENCVVDLKLETPDERAKKVSLLSKITDTESSFISESTFTINDLVYVGNVALDIGEKQPYYNIELKYPSGKVDKLYGKQIRATDDSFAGESKIILHIYDFTLDFNYDVTIRDIEDFQIKAYVDSPKLKVNKISLQANTKDVHGAKKLIVNAKEGDRNIINGATTYKIRKEDDKIIIDGQGTLTVNNDKKSGSFKVLYRELNEKRDKEDGIQLTINSVIGTKAFDIEYILTTDHFKYLTSYCVEKKDCAHVEIEAKDQEDIDVLVINVDLRPLGVSHEFGLKSETQIKNFKHNMDVHLVSNQFKYQYSAFVLPTESHFTLTTPKRIISLETKANSPKPTEPFRGSAVLYLNKKLKPNEKTVLDFEGGPTVGAQGSFSLKLTTPALKKPLSVKYKTIDKTENKGDYMEEGYEIILDILPTGNKKFIISQNVKGDSRGEKSMKIISRDVLDLQPFNYILTEDFDFALDVEKVYLNVDYKLTSSYKNNPVVFSYNARGSQSQSYEKLVLYNKMIFDVNHKSQFSKEYTIIESKYNIVGLDPKVSKLEIKGGNTLKFAAYSEANPNKKLQVNAGLIPGSIADFRVDVQTGNNKVDLLHGSVKLDEEDFGKSDYAINSNNIKEYLIVPAKSISQNVFKESSDALTQAANDLNKSVKQFGEIAKNNKPDYTPILSYYQKELDSIREEVITDPSLKELSEKLSDILAAGTKIGSELLKAIGDILEQVAGAVQIQTQKLLESIQKDILPKLQQVVNNLSEKFLAIFESISNLVFTFVDQITAFLDAHQKELKQIATTVSQFSKEIIRFIQKVTEQLSDVVSSELNKITAEIKALPIAEDLEFYVKQISAGKEIPEEQIQQFKLHVDELKSKTKHDKAALFIQLTGSYLEKKMRNQQCDDVAEIAAILAAAFDAVDQLIDDFIEDDDSDLDFLGLPIPSKLLDSLPDLPLFFRSSVLARIISGDIPELSQLRSFATLNPRQFVVPFRKYAVVAQGQHIFTFDGKHLTFPGKCSYLLARDIVNDEFSIVGTYANGAFSEITFADKHDVITLKKSGAVSVNGANSEYPIRKKLTHVFRTYDQIHLKSDTGVRIFCQPDLSLCLFSVSGFYHGSLRGLLGNANAEPYDDYTLPKGNIVTSESDFGNSYKLQANCPAVKTVDHHTHHHDERCTKLFTEISELSICYPFVDPLNFRQACDHGVASNIPNTVEAIASAYSTACASKYIPAFLPSEYVKCENSDKPFELYDMFSVKLPQKAADIVFAIDADESNAEIYKDLIATLGSSLTKDLGERGIKDVDYHVLTYGGEYADYPSHITTNGGKMTFKGKMPNLKFSETTDEDDIDVGHEGVNFVLTMIKSYIDEINLVIGNEPQSRAFVEAVRYPFRAHAAKTIIAVSSRSCPKGLFQGLQKLRAVLLRQPSVTLNLFTPYSDDCNFKVKDEKTTKNVIGFNKEGVFTFSDAKKKPAGNPDLLKDLEYNDFCSEEVTINGGNVFVLDNFNKNKRLYTQIASFNIAETIASLEQQLDCVCIRNGLLTGENVCRAVYSKKKPTTHKKLLKG